MNMIWPIRPTENQVKKVGKSESLVRIIPWLRPLDLHFLQYYSLTLPDLTLLTLLTPQTFPSLSQHSLFFQLFDSEKPPSCQKKRSGEGGGVREEITETLNKFGRPSR